MTRSVAAFLDQRLVELPAGTWVDGRPAVFTVILETGHVSAEERSELASAASPLTFIAQLVIQDVWLHFHLDRERSADCYTCVFALWQYFRKYRQFLLKLSVIPITRKRVKKWNSKYRNILSIKGKLNVRFYRVPSTPLVSLSSFVYTFFVLFCLVKSFIQLIVKSYIYIYCDNWY